MQWKTVNLINYIYWNISVSFILCGKLPSIKRGFANQKRFFLFRINMIWLDYINLFWLSHHQAPFHGWSLWGPREDLCSESCINRNKIRSRKEKKSPRDCLKTHMRSFKILGLNHGVRERFYDLGKITAHRWSWMTSGQVKICLFL